MENEKVKEISEEIDYKESYLRALADYQNLKRVTEQQKAKNFVVATKLVISKILPIIDDIEYACNNGDTGLISIYRKAIIALSELNVLQFGRKGEMFDPMIHNAISTEFDQTKEDNEILDVKRFGYRIVKERTSDTEQVIRVADVVVNKKVNKSNHEEV